MRGMTQTIALGWICGLMIAPVIGSAGQVSPYPISPYLIGENSFNADAAGKDADRVWGRMKDAHFRLIRIGGISNNDKTPSADTHARWVDSIRGIGAEPLIQVSTIDPPAVAAELVRALNVQRKYAIRYWSIGNEPTCVEKTTPAITARIAANVKERALAMRAVDPSIKILFGDECYWKPDLYDPLFGGADDVTGDANGVRYIDGITFHTYPLPGADKNAVYGRNEVIFGAVDNVRGQFQKARKAATAADALHKRSGESALTMSLTEFNVTYWNSSDNSPAGVGVRSFLAGQFVAEVFGLGMEYGAFTVAPWSMLESGGDGRAGDLGLFDGTAGIVPRPEYWHIKLIADNMSGNFAASRTEKADLLRSYASQNQDTAAVMLLNESVTAGYRITLKLKAQPQGTATVPSVFVDAGWEGEISDSIPPQSTLVLKLRKPGLVATRSLYTLALAEKYQPPQIKETPVSLLGGALAAGRTTGAAFRLHAGRLLGTRRLTGAFAVKLTDALGTVVAEDMGTNREWSLPVDALPRGAYFLNVRAGSGSESASVALLH